MLSGILLESRRPHHAQVVTLLTEGYEESLHERGIERYKQMRKAIRNPNGALKMCPKDDFYPTLGMQHEKRLLLPEVEEATPASDVPKRRAKKAGESADGIMPARVVYHSAASPPERARMAHIRVPLDGRMCRG